MAKKKKKDQSKNSTIGIIVAIVVIVVVFLLVQRGGEEAPEVVEEPEPEPEPEVTEPVAQEPGEVSGNIEVSAQRYSTINADGLTWDIKEGQTMVKSIQCTINEEGKAEVTFSVENPRTVEYTIGLSDPTQGETGIQFSVNGGLLQQENVESQCDSTMLAAGGSTTCTVTRDVKRSPLDRSQKANNVRVKAPKWTSRVNFLCPE